VNDHQHFI